MPPPAALSFLLFTLLALYEQIAPLSFLLIMLFALYEQIITGAGRRSSRLFFSRIRRALCCMFKPLLSA